MTAAINTRPSLTSRLINGILAIKPLGDFAKHQARSTIIKRAESIGVLWRKRVEELRSLNWDNYFNQLKDPQLICPEYYIRSFHAYTEGNLNWEAAFEQEVAAYAVQAHLWPNIGVKGDPKLRQTYHDILKEQITKEPQDILDLGCGVGMSSFALQNVYPQAKITGLDLSPYFLSVAAYNSQQRHTNITWKHAAAEATSFPDASFDLISVFLVFHELPQNPTKEIFKEARRLLRPGGFLTLMDMNPRSEIYSKMPPYILTLLKSTEPYLDEYFTLDIEAAMMAAGFEKPTITSNSPRHRTIIATAK